MTQYDPNSTAASAVSGGHGNASAKLDTWTFSGDKVPLLKRIRFLTKGGFGEIMRFSRNYR